MKWEMKQMSPTSLHLDTKNPRLGPGHSDQAPRAILQHLFQHDKAMDIAESIATRGFFLNEPLLAVKEDGRLVVVEGNRRLAALKALRDPSLLEESYKHQITQLANRIADPSIIADVPVVIAPNRKATDRLIAGRHIGTPVLAWRAENRANFILDKLAEGYDTDTLCNQLGFSIPDIEKARQTKAVIDMARSLELPEEVKTKLDSPKAKVFSTLERVFDSSVGRKYLHVEADPEHGLKGTTTKEEFLRGFTKLVVDVALRKVSSRKLNTNDDIRTYFEGWDEDDRPKKKQGSFVPSDIIKNATVPSRGAVPKTPRKTSKRESTTVLPKNFKIRHGNDRLIDIHRELTKLKRDEFPNAGAVLLRVFFELSVLHYFERTNQLDDIIARIEKKENRKLPHGVPTLRQMVPEITRIAKEHLKSGEARIVEKAVKPDASAPFTISDLHAFVHSKDFPVARDILQFWVRTEPLFRLMLEQDSGDGEQ